MTIDRSFNEEILACIKKGLSALGEDSASLILFYVHSLCKLDAGDLVERPQIFEQALHHLLGEGANAINYLVIEAIKAKFKLSKTNITTISEAVIEANDCFCRNNIEREKNRA
ncbi:MAG: hypothetical protein ACYC7D_01130 [Nitrososphaerales archaeon]